MAKPNDLDNKARGSEAPAWLRVLVGALLLAVVAVFLFSTPQPIPPGNLGSNPGAEVATDQPASVVKI